MKSKLLVLGLGIIMGCNNLKSGKIISISYLPPHNEDVMKNAYGGNGVSFVWVKEWIPDTTWFITFENNGKHKQVCVSKQTAYQYNIGDNIQFN